MECPASSNPGAIVRHQHAITELQNTKVKVADRRKAEEIRAEILDSQRRIHAPLEGTNKPLLWSSNDAVHIVFSLADRPQVNMCPVRRACNS